jgi:hypothetical protein
VVSNGGDVLEPYACSAWVVIEVLCRVDKHQSEARHDVVDTTSWLRRRRGELNSMTATLLCINSYEASIAYDGMDTMLKLRVVSRVITQSTRT